MRKRQGLKSRNLIRLPLDIPEVEVIRVEVNERGDYIVTVESMRNHAVRHCLKPNMQKFRAYCGLFAGIAKP